MKKHKYIIKIIIVGILFWLISKCQFKCDIIYEKTVLNLKQLEDNTIISLASLVTNIIYTISSIVSIFVVVYFYKKAYREENTKLIREEKVFWFRNIVLDKNWQNINEYFEQLNNISSTLENLNKEDFQGFKEVLTAYAREKANLQETFVDFLLFYDHIFSLKIKNYLEKFQDELGRIGVTYIIKDSNNSINIKKLVQNHKTEFYKLIFQYEKTEVCKVETIKK